MKQPSSAETSVRRAVGGRSHMKKWAGHSGTAHFRGGVGRLDLAGEGVDAVQESTRIDS